MILIQPPTVQNWNSLINKPSILSDNQISWDEIQNKPTTLAGYGITNGQPLGNELTALQDLSDSAGFLKKTGNGTYSIDVNSYLNLTGGTVTGDLVSTSATASTSTTTGAIRAASLGVTGAIFANTVSANSYNLIPVSRGAGGVSANTAVGSGSLQANTTGSGCSAFGVDSLRVNTTGNYCSAFGISALRANTTGISCSAFGVDSLRAITTSSNCSAFGVSAGRYQSDGVTEISVTNNSCFIGTSTKGTQNATNENVFGFNATGNGSNTMSFGDSSITNNFFRGVLSLNGTQVISTRRTGWAVPTGTATRTTFATSTITLLQLAERVKALIDDLTAHGLIGA